MAGCSKTEQPKSLVKNYALSVEQAKEIFTNYESTYEDYYLLAQNNVYVYAVSDEKTFETAGFNTLETNGILFIWE